MKLRNTLALLAMLSLAACQQPDGAQSGNTDELQKAQAEIARLEKANASLIAEKAKAAQKSPAEKKAKDEIGAPMDYDYEGDEAAADAVAAPSRKLCWQDYCPCENPETPLDTTICRNAKGGIEMSDEQWAIGAQARDSKRSGDRLNREMDDILSDMRSKR
jgi:hypothetical protein